MTRVDWNKLLDLCSSVGFQVRNSLVSSVVRQTYTVAVACVASVPVRAKCCVSRASEDSSRAKTWARAKTGKERGGGGAARERLQANPTILKNAHRFLHG